jgi:hypothetical protein
MLTAYRWCRFESAATLTVEEQRRSKSYSDQVIAWVIETVSPTHNIYTVVSAPAMRGSHWERFSSKDCPMSVFHVCI